MKSLNEAMKEFKLNEAKNNDWSKGIVFGNALSKDQAQQLVKDFTKDAKGAYPKLNISFKIVKEKDDSYGVEAKIDNQQPKDMEFDAYARMHGNAKKDIKSMLVDEIKKMQMSESENPLTNPNRKDKEVEEAKSEDETMKPYIDKASKEIENLFSQGKAGYGEGNAVGHVVDAIKKSIPANQLKWIIKRLG